MTSEETHISPLGWQDVAETEHFGLSDIDHTMPKIYVLIAEVLKLPKNTDADII